MAGSLVDGVHGILRVQDRGGPEGWGWDDP